MERDIRMLFIIFVYFLKAGVSNRTANIRTICWKTTVLSFHRRLINTVVKNKQYLNIDCNFDHESKR